MDLLWMILPVILVCAEAQKVTEVKVKLGQNITLTCSGEISDTYWYLESHSQIRIFISRSFRGDPASTMNFFSNVGSKYSAWENSLMIPNITAEDCRLYFCGRMINDNIQFVDTFRLLSDHPVCPHNNNYEQQNHLFTQSEFITYASLTLNGFVLATGLICSWICLKKWKKKKISNCQVTDPSPVPVETNKYEESHFPPRRPLPPIPAAPPEPIDIQHSASSFNSSRMLTEAGHLDCTCTPGPLTCSVRV